MNASGNQANESLTVLYVDDDEDLLRLVPQILKSQDDSIQIHTENSAYSALDYLENNSVDAIVSDYEMPDLDGLEFYEQVDNNIPFLMYSAKRPQDFEVDPRETVESYFRKSSDLDVYGEIISEIRSKTGSEIGF